MYNNFLLMIGTILCSRDLQTYSSHVTITLYLRNLLREKSVAPLWSARGRLCCTPAQECRRKASNTFPVITPISLEMQKMWEEAHRTPYSSLPQKVPGLLCFSSAYI